jgi:hypothetical protein
MSDHERAENLPSPAPAPAPVPPPPPPLVSKWIRSVLAFTVSVALGLAPYLGKVNVPGFDALLTLIPDSLQPVALPISAAIMGLVAVWIQWSAGDRPTTSWLGKRFRATFVLGCLGILFLFVAETFVVVRIPIPAQNRTGAYLIGFKRLVTSPCPPSMSDAECIKRVTAEESKIAEVWGDTQIRVARLVLLGSYFLATGSFGLLVGLLVLKGSLPATERP